MFRSNISREGYASHQATFIKRRASYFIAIEYSVTSLRILILIFIILVLAVFEVLIVVTAKDVASEVKDCARDDLEGRFFNEKRQERHAKLYLLLDGKSHIEVYSQGGLNEYAIQNKRGRVKENFSRGNFF